MATSSSSSPSSSSKPINPNVPLAEEPVVWQPAFHYQGRFVTVQDTVMQDDLTAITVAAALTTPRDAQMLAQRSDVEACKESMALALRTSTSLTNLTRRLRVRVAEVESLTSQNMIFRQLLAETQAKNQKLLLENRNLKVLVESYDKRMELERAELKRQRDQLQEQNDKLLAQIQSSTPINPTQD